MTIEYIGYVAAILTTGSFLPQVIKTIRTKDTSGISLYMYLFFVLGIALWFIYGLKIKSMPIILANLFTGIMSTIILFYKVKEVRGGKFKEEP